MTIERSTEVIEQFYPSIHVENLLDEIWKLVNLISYVSQRRESPWLDATIVVYQTFEGLWYQATECAILLCNYIYAFSSKG